MDHNFLTTTLGRTGRRVFRLGLSASYRPGEETVRLAFESGVNYFFAYGFDTQMTRALRGILATHRDEVVLATGAYNLIFGHTNIRKTCEKRLRQYRTDHLDVLLFLGVMKEKEFPETLLEEMVRLRSEGKARWIGISTHNRRFAGRLVEQGALDVLMIRYNAAHRGAEQEIFPLCATHDPGIVSYTATRWTGLLRRPKGWPNDAAVPTAGMAYRFVLAHPAVDIVLTAPKNRKEFEQNLASVRLGPPTDEEMASMRQFGDAVHKQRKWFM